MPAIKGDRTVMLDGQVVMIMTPTERAGLLGQAKANVEYAARMLFADAVDQADIALDTAKANVTVLRRDEAARREHRRLARAK